MIKMNYVMAIRMGIVVFRPMAIAMGLLRAPMNTSAKVVTLDQIVAQTADGANWPHLL